MTRAEWKKEVQKALIDLGKTTYGMAKDLNVTGQWIYQIMAGNGTSGVAKLWEKRISKYCGIAYPEEGFDDESV